MPECVHPPTRGLTTVLLIFWAGMALFTRQAEAAVTVTSSNNECPVGWSVHDLHCYKMFEERETFSDADSTCRLFGAEMVHGMNQQDFDYIRGFISTSTNFGYWYGALINDMKEIGEGGPFEVYIKKDVDSDYDTLSKDFYGKTMPIPPLKALEKPMNTDCVSLNFNIEEYAPFMLPIACNITLPYVCRGGLETAPNPNKTESNNYLVTKTDVFWISSAVDRKNFNDASKACIAKAMTLASFRSWKQTWKVHKTMMNLSLDNADPWWIGLQIMNGVGSWTSGLPVNQDVVMWTREPLGVVDNDFASSSYYVMLTDMTLLMTNEDFRAPFVCYKRTGQSGQYGCPHTWSRAGQSCYRNASGANYVTREKGVALCNKMGSHLVSLDTPMEKQWFVDSMVQSYAESNQEKEYVWTSLNDKQTQGTFVWGDGSNPKPAVLTWAKALEGDSECYKLLSTGSVENCPCEYTYLPGCQYTSKNGTLCVSKKWSNLNGNCYYTPGDYDFYSEVTSQNEMLHVCYDDLVKYDSAIKLQKLMLKSEDVIKLYEKVFPWTDIWTGLRLDQGIFLWPDNSKADINILTSVVQPDRGTKEKPKRCTLIDRQGWFSTASCDSYKKGKAVCEKEIAYHPTGVQGQGYKGASTNVRPGFGTKLLAFLTAVVLVTGFLA